MITYLLFILIGCQSLPVISIGGSTFKIYELLGLILLMQGIKCRRMLFLQCCFFYFIIAPCLSLLWGWLVLGYPTGFFDYFVGIGSECVPTNSLLREFIGGGCFQV